MAYLTKPDADGIRHTICTRCGETWALSSHRTSADRQQKLITRTHKCPEKGTP